MPVFQIKNVSEYAKVGIWKIDESEDILIKMALEKVKHLNDQPNTSNKTRIKQWFATRLLLNEFFNEVQISYDEYGKPHLSNDWFISISHANEFVVINLNKDNPCGIDIEKITQKVERIKHKFLNPLDLVKVNSLEDLTIYWGAKEALYKYYGKKEVLFIEHLFLEKFSKNNKVFTGKIELPLFKVELRMVYEKIEDYMLVYTL